MTNHIHLLVTPMLASSLPRMMQSLGRVYVQYFNRAHDRTGTLWEGRYKATIVEDEHYLLTCMRYIELNPVRGHMVGSPAEYPWSSFRANAHGAVDVLVVHHELYRRLGKSRDARQAAYLELFGSAISEQDLLDIRDATQHGWALGGTVFRTMVAASGRRAERLPLGRPMPNP
jgi:putative transposase